MRRAANGPGAVLCPGHGARHADPGRRPPDLGRRGSILPVPELLISQQLLLTIFLPLLGAVGLWLAASAGRYVARVIALAVRHWSRCFAPRSLSSGFSRRAATQNSR